MPLFDLESVSFRHGRHHAIENVTLHVSAGERIALLGANGSGKSTLLRLLDGLYLPSSGEVRFHGEALTEKRLQDAAFAIGFRRRVGLLFQDPDVQLFNATVFDEVAFGPLQMGWPRSEVVRRVENALELLSILPLRERPPFHLSGGEKKRVALASVLVLEPEVLLLDEPTAALDPKTQRQLIDFLRRQSSGTTMITATHDLQMIEEIADTCYVLSKGRLVAHGPAAEILAGRELLEQANLIATRPELPTDRIEQPK